MAKLKSATLKFPASGSPDVQGYRMYVEPEGIPVTYDSSAFDLGKNEVMEGEVTYIVTDLSGIPGLTTKDGIYNIGVVAVDDAGNESSMSTLDSVPLDFMAPDPPGPLSFISA